MENLVEQLTASELPLCHKAAAEIIALQDGLIAQARAFGQWCDGVARSGASTKPINPAQGN